MVNVRKGVCPIIIINFEETQNKNENGEATSW